MRSAADYLEYLESKDPTLHNDEQREKIQRMFDQRGGCWLGIVNKYKADPPRSWLEQWQPDRLVYNFEFCFAVPRFDQQLVELLQRRYDAPYTGTKQDAVFIDAIFARIEELGGVHLVWV
jgi:hypothetical protein